MIVCRMPIFSSIYTKMRQKFVFLAVSSHRFRLMSGTKGGKTAIFGKIDIFNKNRYIHSSCRHNNMVFLRMKMEGGRIVACRAAITLSPCFDHPSPP